MASISGNVTSDGAAVPRAWIFLDDSETRADDNGRYSAKAPAGATSIVVFKEGYRTQLRPVEVPASGRLTEDFELEPNPLYDESGK